MAKLYDLTGRYKNLKDLLENEEVDKEVLYESLNGIKDQIKYKTENICKVLRSETLEVNALKEEEDRIAKIRKAKERKIKILKEYLAESLLKVNLHKVNTPLFTIYFRKTKKLMLDEELIDSKYKKVVEEIDTASIRVDLQEGKEVAGARFEENESLVIQ